MKIKYYNKRDSYGKFHTSLARTLFERFIYKPIARWFKRHTPLAEKIVVNYCIVFTFLFFVTFASAYVASVGYRALTWLEELTAPISYAATSTPKLFTVKELQNEVPPILKKIAKCESGDRQFYDNGKVVRNKITPSDIGRYQIHEIFWGQKASEMGFNIYTEKGNEQMALWLYQEYGTEPWFPSKRCWSK